MERISQFEHPPMFEIIGASVPSDEINRRLQKVFNELPRLWTDYAARVLPYREQGTLDSFILADILTAMSLRDFVFLEWDTESFEKQFSEIIRIARERGSHDDFQV